jgi:hypothetical protein
METGRVANVNDSLAQLSSTPTPVLVRTNQFQLGDRATVGHDDESGWCLGYTEGAPRVTGTRHVSLSLSLSLCIMINCKMS